MSLPGVLAVSQSWAAILESLHQVYQLSSSCRGPGGNFHIVRAPGTVVHVTSSSRVILSQDSLRMASVATRLLCDVASRVVSEFGDGGLFVAAFASRLVIRCAELELPLQEVIRELSSCSKLCMSTLLDPGCPIVAKASFGSMSTILPVVETIVASKAAARLTASDVKLLSTLIVQAFLAALPPDVNTSKMLQCVRVMTVVGKPVRESRVDPHSAFIDTVLPPTLPSLSSRQLHSIVLFDVSLCLQEPPVHLAGETTVMDTNQRWSTSTAEGDAMRKLGGSLVALGVSIVATQKLMHPILEEYLLNHGILPLQRLSIRHIGAVQALTGALVLSSWTRTLDARALGLLRLVELHSNPVTGKSELKLIGYDGKPSSLSFPMVDGKVTTSSQWTGTISRTLPIVTLMLCSPSSHASQELSLVVKTALTTLCHLLRSPLVVAGGGATEIYLSQRIRQLLEEVDASGGARRSSVMKTVFADSLDDVVRTFCCKRESSRDPASLDAITCLKEHADKLLRPESKSVTAHSCYGWDPTLEEPIVVLAKTISTQAAELRVVDLLSMTVSKLEQAVEAAIAISRISLVVEKVV